ncbi:MAG: hypothetical protein ABSF90_32325, partial [Syntrophobacteraceae bacterium]
MAQKRPSQCPNCGMKLPREHPQLNANLPWLRGFLQLVVTGEEAFRCPSCSCVWKQSPGQALKVEVTPLGVSGAEDGSIMAGPEGARPPSLDGGEPGDHAGPLISEFSF